jgi:hypothetical protein
VLVSFRVEGMTNDFAYGTLKYGLSNPAVRARGGRTETVDKNETITIHQALGGRIPASQEYFFAYGTLKYGKDHPPILLPACNRKDPLTVFCFLTPGNELVAAVLDLKARYLHAMGYDRS